MFTAPVATRRAHAALHLVENEKDIVFVAARSQFLQPFAAEMIVTALSLDWLDDDGADVDVALIDEVADFALRFLLARNHVSFALRFRQRKIDVWARHAWPIEFRTRCAKTVAVHGEISKVGMIEADERRSEKSVKLDEPLSRDSVV